MSALSALEFGGLDAHEASSIIQVGANVKDVSKLLKYYQLLKDEQKYAGFRRWFVPGTPFDFDALPKHKAFLFAGAKYRQRYFSAANRVGKTIAGAYEVSLHATGEYPPEWEGKRFDEPCEILVAGKSSETTRDIIQKELLGSQGSYGTGMIPKEFIIETRSRPGVSGGVGQILVKHKSGGVSEILFKSYDQGREAFEGIKRHVVWLDELPDALIYSEAFMRTMSYRGITFITATAKQGLTPLVLSFYNGSDWLPVGQELPTIVKLVREQRTMQIQDAYDPDQEVKKEEEYEKVAKAVIVAGWDDAPWLSEEDKKAQLAECPPHLVSATSTGLPGIGSGTIFTTPLEEVVTKDFPIPDHWKNVNGMDVGWNNTGAVRVAINPDTGIAYVVAEHKVGKKEPVVHAKAIKAWGDWIPIEIDPASKGRNQNDGKQLFNLYRKEGLRLIEANNAVETGLLTLQQLFAAGMLKIFSSCIELQKEYVTYSRDEHGKIIKKNDHVMDALRYAVMGLHHARVKPANYGKKRGGTSGGQRYDI
jgi:phage terminase large subunit-like protein